jgi:hypothetical protein
LVAAELVLGVRTVRAWDTGFRADERLVQAERALGERGWLVSFAALAPRVDVWKPALVELPQDEIFREVLEARTPVPEYAAAGLANLRGLLDYGPVALDLAYERLPDDPVLALRRPYAEALVAAARAELDTELFDHPDWPVLLLRPR